LLRSLAIGTAAVAGMAVVRVVLNWLDPQLGDRTPFSLMYFAITCAALGGGMAGGLWATALATVLLFYLIERRAGFLSNDPYRLFIFIIFSLLVVYVCQRARRARCLAEAALAERNRSEHRTAARLDSISDAFVALDRQWRFTYVNQSYERFFNRRREDLIGKTIWECFSKIIGTDAERHYKRAMADHVAVRFELVSQYTGKWVQSGAFPSSEGLSIYLQDIDDRKRAEAALRDSESRYRQLVETAQEGIWMIDAAARTSYVNRAMADMLGYTTQEMLGRPMYDFMDDAARTEATANVEKRPQGEAARHDFRFRRRDGSDFHAHLSTAPMHGPQGEYLGTLAMVSDVSERRRAEAERSELLLREQKARAEAEAANRRKDQFLAVLSHELRTPLTPVLARLAMLRREADGNETIVSGLDMIRRNVELEARLIDDLLDVTRLARGQLKLHPEDLNAHSRIQAALAIYEGELKSRRQTVSLELRAPHPFVHGDPVRLQQIFWNLIGNSVKYTPHGGHITIRSANAQSAAAPEKLIVQVIDTGIGIAPEVMPRLFDPFEQGEQTLSRRYGGLGLGLSISRTLAQMHGGTIMAESAGRGLGSTFTLELPVAPELTLALADGSPLRSDAAGAVAQVSALPSPVGSGAGRHILLVDDNEDTLRAMARLLRASGHQVITADSMTSALLAAAQPFDVLITDIGLPDGTGWDLLREIRRRGAGQGDGTVPAIAISGFSMEEDVRRSLDCGFIEHLCKPITPEDLDAAIARAATGAGAAAAPASVG
jgi:PAS domain S-box-containing protein